MSGFEVIGVVLGSIPLLISALEHYERGIKTIQIVRRRAKVMHSLATALSTEQTILRNTCETLLGGIIDPKHMKPLLAEPFGPLWKNPDIEALVEQRLDHTLNDFKALALSMNEAVEEIRSKLSLGSDFELKIDDGAIGKKDIIKIAIQFSTHEDSLKRLADINQKLDLLMTGNLRNEAYRKVCIPEKLFNLLQTVSRGIYNALSSSLSCTCAQSHGVGFGLPAPRVTGRTQDAEALVRRLNFHLILANQPQDAKGKVRSSWVWNELILRLSEIPSKACATAVLPATTGAVIKKARFVKFSVDNTTSPTGQLSSSLNKWESTVSQALSTSHQTSPGPVGRIPPPVRATQQPIQVKDICYALSGKRPDLKRVSSYGYLLDETTQTKQSFEVFPFRYSDDTDECANIHLRDVFSKRCRPSLAQKYHIAATVASSVLFLHKTLWMPATLTIEDVFVISRLGDVDFSEIYLAKKSFHCLGTSTIGSNHGPSTEEAGVPTLLHLGILLMEVMLWKPVYEFWDNESVDLSDTALEEIFDYTAAKGFARIEAILKRIEWISSPEFKKVVEHCIKCDLNTSSLTLDDEIFRQAVYKDIVLPLQEADQFASGKMIIGKGNYAWTA
ncbi:hypothetical protein NUW58_g6293 [Xylaria curta]|uniref:Uncharacterized protein n=1 Tax=Xylaria curta TaxID=42375 RepID=A0ACC1NWC2_9PEZI|nr:hypothetical protein NUW58_g6293 [Xylaria curta]